MQLSEINNGALQEVFDYEFDKVLKNIRDINTDPKAKRKVTIEMTISPNEKRTMAILTLRSSTPRPRSTVLPPPLPSPKTAARWSQKKSGTSFPDR